MEETMTKRPRSLELLAPAGDMERLTMAVLYGADAVYLAGTSFGMRSFAGNFTPEELPRAVALAHERGVRVHVTVNTMPRGDEVPRLPGYLEELDAAGVDALILADLGAFMLAGRYAPHCERHISTQQSIANSVCARAWYDLGASRVVLARELSLRRSSARRPQELELETLDTGPCASPRFRTVFAVQLHDGPGSTGGRLRPALPLPVRPDGGEAAWGVFSPCLKMKGEPTFQFPGYVHDRSPAGPGWRRGVDCIKLEGRAKSAYYAAIVTGAYRHGIDAAAGGTPLDPVWRDEVEHVSHRIYSTGFYYGFPGQYTESSRYIRQWQICALVLDCGSDGMATMSLRNKFAAGDTVELVGPDTRPFSFQAPVMQGEDGTDLREPRTPQMVFRMQLPRPVPPYSILRRAVELSAQ